MSDNMERMKNKKHEIERLNREKYKRGYLES